MVSSSRIVGLKGIVRMNERMDAVEDVAMLGELAAHEADLAHTFHLVWRGRAVEAAMSDSAFTGWRKIFARLRLGGETRARSCAPGAEPCLYGL